MLAAAILCAAAPAQSYSIRKLVAPGFAHGVAWDIDNAGNVVGEAYDAQGLPHAVVWRNGTANVLPNLVGGSESSARTIDDEGAVGGYGSNPVTPSSAASWVPNGNGWSATDLGSLPNTVFSVVLGLGANRLACGYSDDAFLTFPVAWLDATNPASLRLLPMPGNVYAGAANGAHGNQIVGYLEGPNGVFPTSWLLQGGSFVATVLPTLSPWGIATDVGVNGRIVGSSVSPLTGRLHFVEWQNGVLFDHGTIGRQDCVPEAVNAHGDIVGWSRTFSVPPYVAVWKPDGRPIASLQQLLPAGTRWTVTRAQGINDDRAIVGMGDLDGFIEAFLMTPVKANLAAPYPGTAGTVNKFAITNLVPGNTVALFVAVAGGETRFTGCLQALDLDAPSFVAAATADAAGHATLAAFAPPLAAGLPLMFQAYDRGGCATTNVVPFTFR